MLRGKVSSSRNLYKGVTLTTTRFADERTREENLRGLELDSGGFETIRRVSKSESKVEERTCLRLKSCIGSRVRGSETERDVKTL